MKRFLKYWTIRLLGREFVALPKTCKLVSGAGACMRLGRHEPPVVAPTDRREFCCKLRSTPEN